MKNYLWMMWYGFFFHVDIVYLKYYCTPNLQRSDIKIVKNSPDINAMLWKVKHLVKVTPIRLPTTEVDDADPRCCFLKVSSSLIIFGEAHFALLCLMSSSHQELVIKCVLFPIEASMMCDRKPLVHW